MIPNTSLKKLIYDEAKNNKNLELYIQMRKNEIEEEQKNYHWQWKLVFGDSDDDDTWESYDETTSKRIEKQFQNKDSKGLVVLNALYAIDLKQMIQFDIESQMRYRPVRRSKGKTKTKDIIGIIESIIDKITPPILNWKNSHQCLLKIVKI